MPVIGPTFHKDMEDAGLTPEQIGSITWSENGIQFDPRTPQSTIDAVNAVLAAHDPNAPAPLQALSSLEELVQDVFIALDPEGSKTPQEKTDAVSRIKSRFQGRPGAR